MTKIRTLALIALFSLGTLLSGQITKAGGSGGTGTQGPTGPAGLTWRGAWSSSTTYAFRDAVSFGGSTYYSLQSGINHQPDTSGTFWSLMVAKGDTGATGAAGAGSTPDGSDGSVQLKGGSALTSDSAFFWDKTNHLLGIGTASPFWHVDVQETGNAVLRLWNKDDSSAAGSYVLFESGVNSGDSTLSVQRYTVSGGNAGQGGLYKKGWSVRDESASKDRFMVGGGTEGGKVGVGGDGNAAVDPFAPDNIVNWVTFGVVADKGGLYLMSPKQDDSCDLDHLWLLRTLHGSTGVADTVQGCLKTSSDTYAWATIYPQSGGAGGGSLNVVSSLPGTCTQGSEYFLTTGNPNAQIFTCSATNTLVQNGLLGGSGALSRDASTGALDIVPGVVPTLSGSNTFSGLVEAVDLKSTAGTGAPHACSVTADIGHFWTDTTDSANTHLKQCAATSSSIGWKTVY